MSAARPLSRFCKYNQPVQPLPESLKIAFIGTHGVGKTTLCYGLAAKLKTRDISLDVVHEVARRCPLPINEETGIASETWILHTQVAEEMLASARYSVVLCDRSILDNYVYLLVAAGAQEAIEGLLPSWMRTYDLLVHVPITEDPDADGIRATDPVYQQRIDQRLDRELERFGLEAMRLDPLARNGWIDAVAEWVWQHTASLQMSLLEEPT